MISAKLGREALFWVNGRVIFAEYQIGEEGGGFCQVSDRHK